MATYGSTRRRGLPRRPGGDAWPPAGDAPVDAPVPASVDAADADVTAVDVGPTDVAAESTSPNGKAAARAAALPATAGAPAATSREAIVNEVDASRDLGVDHSASAPAPVGGVTRIRRGLPRTSGGEPWPPAGSVPGSPAAPTAAAATVPATESASPDPAASHAPAGAAADATKPATAEQTGPDAAAAPASGVPAAAVTASGATPTESPSADSGGSGAPVAASPGVAAAAPAVRRGLPRTPGGEPWPPAGSVPGSAGVPTKAVAPAPETEVSSAAPAASHAPAATDAAAQVPSTESAASPAAVAPAAAASHAAAPAVADIAVRRGLPRTSGGEPWPPADFVPRPATAAEASVAPEESAVSDTAVATPVAAPTEAPPAEIAPAPPPAKASGDAAAATLAPDPAAPAREQPAAAAAAAVAVATESGEPREPREPLAFTRTVWPGSAPRHHPAPEADPVRHGPFTRGQWAGVVIVGGAGLLVAAAMVVFAVRWFLSLEVMQDFLVSYPGEYHLPEGAPVGLPAWLGWQHFFNVFLIVLIIRTGLQIRTEKRPTAFWAPKRDRKKKISLTIWLHQSLDILWLVNGAVFLALLFATGQWMRIVPTSWEVFPNALSAALQYVSLEWPTENGWVNYNSLQQLAYFATVFLAAPLAAITGYRMSLMWPKKATALNRAYPIEWARAIHFPVMIYFVLFIIAHVTLVFATGALRNLNHMYAAQDVVNWTGFWIFALSMLVVVGGWVAARPLVVAPIARMFGNVVSR